MTVSRPLTEREERRFERRAACRYTRRIMGRRCRRVCLRCLWDLIEGGTRRQNARSQARYETIRDCPHENRLPNLNEYAPPDAEYCGDCGVGLVRRLPRQRENRPQPGG